MLTEFEEGSIATRKLILHDAMAILSLALGTIVLFLVTLFLFRSFGAHRVDLAQRWSERGRTALQAGKPDEAIVALRTALLYAPGKRDYELLLAQALGEAGHTDESYQYFMGLWDSEPGNGPVNLELARLAAKRHDPQASRDAINFYRAAIYGTWEGDGVARRAAVRIELAGYLIAGHDLPAARMELLIAGGNAPDDYDRDMSIGNLLDQTEDPADAWTYYQKAIAARPGDPEGYAAAGRVAYKSGDYENAVRMLGRAHDEWETRHIATAKDFDDRTMLENAMRILELMPAPTLPARERVVRILDARAIARKRLDACSEEFASPGAASPALQALSARWAAPDGTADATTLLGNAAQQDSAMQLVYDTEVQTQKLCGAAAGDDALLLRLAANPQATSLSGAERTAQAIVPRD